MSPSFSVDDSYSLLQHRSHCHKMALGAFSEITSVPLLLLLGLLVFFNLPASPTFGFPMHCPWNTNPSWSPNLLQSPTVSRSPTHLWAPSLSGFPSYYSASNPFSASQSFLNSHSSFWPNTLIFGWTPPFTAGHSSYTPF